MRTYFFDTYALVEVFKGNENYKEYASCSVVTTYFHLFELYYNLIRAHDKETVNKFFERLKEFCIELRFEWIIDASELKLKNKNLSYADCLGYIVAKKLGVKFLTGDKEFENLANVKFMK